MPRDSGSERRAAIGPRGSYTEPRLQGFALFPLCAFHALRFFRFALFPLCAFCVFCAFLFVDSRGRSVPSVLCVLLLCVLFICHYPIPSEPTIRHSITAKRKNTSITSCNSLSTFANTIGASRRFVLAERLRGSDTGSVQSEERFGRNPCRKTRFAGALWLTQGEIADLQSGLAQRRSPRNRPGGRAAMLRFEADANSAKRPAAMLRFEAER